MNDYEKRIHDILINYSDHDLGSTGEYFVSELPFCLRKMVWTRHFGMRIPPNAKMALGTILHTHIEEILKKPNMAEFYNGMALQFEVKTRTLFGKTGIVITGHCDVLVSQKQQTEEGIALLPSCVEEWKFSRSAVRSGEDIPIYYAAQVNTYSSMLGAGKWRVNVVNPEDFNVISIDGTTDKQVAENMMNRAVAVYDIFREGSSPIHLLSKNFEGVMSRTGKTSNMRALIDEVVGSLPDGPEYGFECSTRYSKCTFYDLCGGGCDDKRQNKGQT